MMQHRGVPAMQRVRIMRPCGRPFFFSLASPDGAFEDLSNAYSIADSVSAGVYLLLGAHHDPKRRP